MRIDARSLVKIGLFACLALTAYKGFMKLPEVYPVLAPEGFYKGQVNDGENSLFMKERHDDFNRMTGKALELRLREMQARGDTPPPGALVTLDRVERAIRKTKAKDLRNADAVVLAEEKLGRAVLRRDGRWAIGLAGPVMRAGGAPGAAAAGAPSAPSLTGTSQAGDTPSGSLGQTGGAR